jgi:hypothetical protein
MVKTTNLKFVLQNFVICVPCFHDRRADLVPVWNILFSYIFTKKKKELAELWAFNDVNGLVCGD